jgi:hypothetical protein
LTIMVVCGIMVVNGIPPKQLHNATMGGNMRLVLTAKQVAKSYRKLYGGTLSPEALEVVEDLLNETEVWQTIITQRVFQTLERKGMLGR